MRTAALILSLALADAAAAAPVPAAAPPVAGFVEGATRTTIPFDLVEGRIVVHALVDGRTLALRVDPAGPTVLTPRAAAGLRSVAVAGHLPAAAQGEVEADALELGAYLVPAQRFLVVDLTAVAERDGFEVDGAIGSEVFERIVASFDFAGRRLILIASAAHAPPSGVAPLALTRGGGLPGVAGELDGMAGWFAIDLGSRAALRLAPSFVAAHALAQRYHHRHATALDWDSEGAVRGFVARGGWLKLGGAEVPGPLVEIPSERAERAAPDRVVGSVGTALLQRFTVTIDPTRQQLLLEPNAGWRGPEPFDRSGMWLNLDRGELLVAALMANGPAARAQVQPHDRIVSVDGVAASELTLPALRASLREGPDGRHVKLALRRDGKLLHAVVVLDTLVP